MPKRFRHLNVDWEATATGASHVCPAGSAYLPIDRWGVIFRSISQPERGEYRAWISERDPASAEDAELRKALEEQLTLAAIDRSRYIWRPAEAIARDTGLETERVRFILENTADDVIAGGRNPQGYWLYTTRDHLSKTAGDVMKRFYEVEETS